MSRQKVTVPVLGAASRPVESKRSEKITCVMLERQAAYLDAICIMIRLRHQKAIARTQIVRALVEFMQRSGVDYSQFASVAEIVVYLVGHFRRVAPARKSPLLLESSLLSPADHQPVSEKKTPKT